MFIVKPQEPFHFAWQDPDVPNFPAFADFSERPDDGALVICVKSEPTQGEGGIAGWLPGQVVEVVLPPQVWAELQDAIIARIPVADGVTGD